MRRLLLLCLLCLLPLQISWAAVANYCGHEQDKAAQHFGHHADEHKASSGASDDGKQSGQAFGHDHSHLSGFIGVLGSCTATAPEYAHPKPHDREDSYRSLATYPPERPQWSAPA